MKFFTKGLELNRLAKGFNGVKLMLMSIDDGKIENETLYILAYISRREIIDRIERFKWNISNPIIVPSISTGRISIAFALQNTVSYIVTLAEETGNYYEIKEILDKGEMYYTIQDSLPSYIKNIAFE